MKSAVSEKSFQSQIVELARLAGWRCYHTFDSRKSAAGKLRPEQREWLEALSRCEGVEARLWRPSDWAEIEKTLARR